MSPTASQVASARAGGPEQAAGARFHLEDHGIHPARVGLPRSPRGGARKIGRIGMACEVDVAGAIGCNPIAIVRSPATEVGHDRHFRRGCRSRGQQRKPNPESRLHSDRLTSDTLQPMNVAALVAEIEAKAARLPVRNVPALRALRSEYSERIKKEPAAQVVELAAALIARGRVHRFAGDELIAARPDALRTLDRAALERLGAGISTWDQVDCFASYLSGPAWREGVIDDTTIAGWARSSDRWWRRAALVSTVPLNVKARGGNGDAGRTLRICKLLLHDRDEMVVKALSWALRALVQCDPAAVRRFVRENEAHLAALARREVRNKLATGRKNPKTSKRTAGN
jgi:3-methyladenine DNA glycosylase AlkD